MAYEFKIIFESPNWYQENQVRIKEDILALPTLAEEKNPDEFWLKDKASQSHWAFDARLFQDKEYILIEVSRNTPALKKDLASLIQKLGEHTSICVVDDDGEPHDF